MKKVIWFLKEKMIYLVFVVMLIGAGLGIHFRPVFMSLKWTLPVALFCMLFQPMVFLKLKQAFVKWTPEKKKYILILFIYYVVLFPILTYFLMKFWLLVLPSVDPKLLAGVVLISLAPLPSSAPAFTNLAGGKFQLTLIGVVWTFILSLFVMPVYAKLILHTVIEVPIMVLIKALVIYIIIPLIVGQLTRYLVLSSGGEEKLMKLKEPLMGLALLGMYWMVFEVFGLNGLKILHNPFVIVYGALIMNAYFLIRMGIAYITGRAVGFDIEHTISLVYSTGSNMTLSTAMAIGAFGALAAVGTALGGPFSDMILMIIFVRIFQGLKTKQKEVAENV